MVREEIAGSTRTLQWKCIESRVESKRLYYGRFILSPLKKGQADTIGIAMRRVLLGEIEGTCITRAKFDKVPHEYSTIVGIEESVHEILMNLKEIVLRSNLYGVQDALQKNPLILAVRPPEILRQLKFRHIGLFWRPDRQ